MVSGYGERRSFSPHDLSASLPRPLLRLRGTRQALRRARTGTYPVSASFLPRSVRWESIGNATSKECQKEGVPPQDSLKIGYGCAFANHSARPATGGINGGNEGAVAEPTSCAMLPRGAHGCRVLHPWRRQRHAASGCGVTYVPSRRCSISGPRARTGK